MYIRSRLVKQIVCGDYHTLALVEGILPNDIPLNGEERYCFINVVGWGENSSK